jgi:hypothetical protein
MFLLVLVILLAIGAWAVARPRGRFLPEFAKLLDRPELVDGPSDGRVARASLKGEFRGRKIVILLQRVRRHFANMLEVSMETRAARTLETAAFTGDKVDREGELALFALEVTHELRLSHEDGWLKARWGESRPSLDFPQRFDAPKWQSVLDAMHTLAGSLERREAR